MTDASSGSIELMLWATISVGMVVSMRTSSNRISTLSLVPHAEEVPKRNKPLELRLEFGKLGTLLSSSSIVSGALISVVYLPTP